MTTLRLPVRRASLLERAALRLGNALVRWADRGATRSIEADAAAEYRERYSDAARTHSVLVRHGMLP